MHKTHTNITHTNASTRSLGCASAQRTLMLTVGGTQRHSIQHRIYKFFFFLHFLYSVYSFPELVQSFFFSFLFFLSVAVQIFSSLSLSPSCFIFYHFVFFSVSLLVVIPLSGWSCCARSHTRLRRINLLSRRDDEALLSSALLCTAIHMWCVWTRARFDLTKLYFIGVFPQFVFISIFFLHSSSLSHWHLFRSNYNQCE